MQSDDEPDLRAAFAKLHRQQREQAPSFAGMRERALSASKDRRNSSWQGRGVPRMAWAAAAGCIGMIVFREAWQHPYAALPQATRLESTAQIDRLITKMEEHLEIESPEDALEYPTDVLLAE